MGSPREDGDVYDIEKMNDKMGLIIQVEMWKHYQLIWNKICVESNSLFARKMWSNEWLLEDRVAGNWPIQ
jgi:hypothetical protein